jgi:hypothetical protein
MGSRSPEQDNTLIGAYDGDTMVGAVLFLQPLNEWSAGAGSADLASQSLRSRT